jgi:hypothetical protein
MQTAAELQVWLTKLYAAREALLLGKSYVVNGRGVTRADEAWITAEIARTETKLMRRSGGGGTDIIFGRGGR